MYALSRASRAISGGTIFIYERYIMSKRTTILDNSPLGWIITMAACLAISVGWYFVFIPSWPYHPAIKWILFFIPVTITVLLPLMYVVRRIQKKRKTGPFKE